MVVDAPLGKIYHVIRVEFNVRTSPCVCCFLWVLNAPALIADSKEEYFLFFLENSPSILTKEAQAFTVT